MVWVLDIVVQVGLMFVSVRVCGLSYGVGFTISGVGLIRVVEYLSLFGSFRKIGGTLFVGPYNKDPTI